MAGVATLVIAVRMWSVVLGGEREVGPLLRAVAGARCALCATVVSSGPF